MVLELNRSRECEGAIRSARGLAREGEGWVGGRASGWFVAYKLSVTAIARLRVVRWAEAIETGMGQVEPPPELHFSLSLTLHTRLDSINNTPPHTSTQNSKSTSQSAAAASSPTCRSRRW